MPGKLRRLGPGEYEVTGLPGGEDAIIIRQGRVWVADLFDSSKKGDGAWVASEEYPTLREALRQIGGR